MDPSASREAPDGGTIGVLHVEGGSATAGAATALERAADGIAVETAAGADAGLERLADGEFDCVVGDYDDPDAGLDFLRTVGDEHGSLPVVLFVGGGDEAVAGEAIAAGAAGYVPKRESEERWELLARRIRGAVEAYRAERARRRRAERYETIVEASGDPVYVLDDEGVITFVNDAFLEVSGYAEGELVGEHISKIMDPDDVERGQRLIRSLLGSGEGRGTFEMDAITADGDRIACENHVAILPSEGAFRGTVGVVRDITERKERERLLERQNERLEEFASIVSHDLRNPLNVLRVTLELAEETGDPEYFEDCRRAVERMGTLIDDLLALARQGRTIGETEPVALADAAEECWRNVETADADLRIAADGTVQADPGRLQQLLENLVRNAVEHGSTGSQASLDDAVEHGSTSSDASRHDAVEHGSTSDRPSADDAGSPAVTVTIGDLEDGFYVADDGPGIPPGERDGLFEGEGGIGLRIVGRIAEAHGWDVAVTESGDGGARFEVTGVRPG